MNSENSTENSKPPTEDQLLRANTELGEKVNKLSDPITLQKSPATENSTEAIDTAPAANPTAPLYIPSSAATGTFFQQTGATNTLVNSQSAGGATTLADATPKRPVRFGTVVWGAIIMVLGIILIAAKQANLTLDPGQTAMWLLLGAGVVMVAGGAVHVLRRK